MQDLGLAKIRAQMGHRANQITTASSPLYVNQKSLNPNQQSILIQEQRSWDFRRTSQKLSRAKSRDSRARIGHRIRNGLTDPTNAVWAFPLESRLSCQRILESSPGGASHRRFVMQPKRVKRPAHSVQIICQRSATGPGRFRARWRVRRLCL